MKETGTAMHGVNVLIVELGLSTQSDDDGGYEFLDVPAGNYHVVSHLDHHFTEAAETVTINAGEATQLDFLLSLTPEKFEITVTAPDEQQTAFETFQNAQSLDTYDLNTSTAASLGEVLDHRVGTGVAKRSAGPGSSRPIVRGFDGDRVLIMEDGIRSGTLSSQSGDHGEVMNTAQLERLEIVKGPATLLYSGNAMGGTVNAVSRHHEHHRHPHQGLRGFVSASGGSNSGLAGSSTGFEYGKGKWMIWGQGGGVRTGDYSAPIEGEVFNSRTKTVNGGGGFGWYGEKMFFSADAKVDDGIYGLPSASATDGDDEPQQEEVERVAIDTLRRSYRFNWGLSNLGSAIESFVLKLSYIDWNHEELEFFKDGNSEIGTAFQNGQFVYRGVFEQRKKGALEGRFGFWGIGRDFQAEGEEALTPPIDQNGFAIFALEELAFEGIKFQVGGRVETQKYHPMSVELTARPDGGPAAVDRQFTGGAAALGVNADLWKGGSFVANYAHSYRPPALEELYNFGPHVGNAAFEIGDSRLKAERGNGIDLSLRHKSNRARGEVSLFYFDFSDFIFPFATGEVVDGLQVIEFTQREARFAGAEASVSVALRSDLWLNMGMDFVDAQETNLNTPLPRIPPLRGKLGFEYRHGGLLVTPELIVASQQHQTFTGETRTPGYAVVNLTASYTWAQQHLAHQFSANVFNVGDRLYRNHSSLIKEFAPEIGRGLRVTYMVRFF
jgi:iron complex outermembrane receptor protein